MSLDIEELRLDKTYTFDVTVDDRGTRYAAELSLSPQIVTLKIMGEESDERRCGLIQKDLQTLRCYDLGCQFLLSGLKLKRARNGTVERHPKPRTYFECLFEVDYVFYLPGDYHPDLYFSGIDIQSSTLNDWIGNTNKQEAILHRYQSGEALFGDQELLREFAVPIVDVGILGIGYNIHAFHSSPEHRVGMHFPPSLTMGFQHKYDAAGTAACFNELYGLLAFITGGELEISRIAVLSDHSGFASSKTPSMYYPRKKFPPRYHHAWILFPLNRDLRFKDSLAPEFPLDAFGIYFGLSDRERQHFDKYTRYRRRENIEERFLGYFRILETLCEKEGSYFDEKALSKWIEQASPDLEKYFGDKRSVRSFVKRLPKWNTSRYNTEKCIQDFLATIPTDVSRKWRYKKEDIAAICKLRNDIVHANDYEADGQTLLSMATFVEVLLVFALFAKLGIVAETAAKIIHLLDGYPIIVMPHSKSGVIPPADPS